MRIRGLLEIARSISSKGLVATAHLCIAHLMYRIRPRLFLRIRDSSLARETARFDRRHATVTCRARVLSGGAENLRQGTGYHPAAAAAFNEMLDRLPIRYEDYAFVDLGSGVGKTLLMASDLPFRRIVGVELGAGLAAVARDNVVAYQSAEQRCHDIAAVHADALDYPLPEGPNVLFLFNPFGEELIGRVVDRICRSQQRWPRPLYVIYYHPQHAAHFDRAAGLELIDSGLGLQGRYRIYRWLQRAPAESGDAASPVARSRQFDAA